MLEKPKGMTDQQWGEFLAECLMGGPFDPPPTWAFIGAWVLIGIVIALAIWHPAFLHPDLQQNLPTR